MTPARVFGSIPPRRGPAAGRSLAPRLAPLLGAIGLLLPALHGTRADGRDRPAAPVPAPGYLERVTSELVLIETSVTDGSGHTVTGLTKDDFVLEVGGLLRPIASVEFRDYGSSSDTAAGAGAPLPPTPAPVAERWPRRFILFFEDDTSSPLGLGQVREAAGRFLASGFAPADEVALASYDGRLRLLHDFSTDRESLRRTAVASVRDASRFSNFPQEQQQHLQEFVDNPTPVLLRTLCEMEQTRYAGALRAVGSLASSLAGWRGYKAIVFMGEGIPESPMEEYWKMLRLFYQRYPARAPVLPETECTLGDEIKDFTRVASASGVTIDTIQTLGLAAGSTKRVFQRANALRTFAINTAGISVTTNDFPGAFHQIDEASRSFYILAYAPEEPADGRYHHVVVRCRRPGVQLRFRRGFTRLPPAEARARAIESAYQFPSMFPGLGMDLETAEGPSEGDRRVVDLVLHVPLERILFLPQGERSLARLEVGFVSLDAARRKTLETSQSIVIDRPPGAGTIGAVNLYCRARLPRDGQTITGVMSDEQSGEVGSATTRLDDATRASNRLVGLSLYSPVESSLWIEVPPDRAPKGAVRTDTVTADAGAADAPIGPALKAVFAPGEPIVAGFKLEPPEASTTLTVRLELRLGALVVRTRTIDVGVADAARAFKVPVPAEGLAAGAYTLSIEALGAGGAAVEGITSFRIAETGVGPSP
ncbi:MAG TPA: VWA domain-containing protein [Patescibacteria group bacterium]|nr:VWA domain-containing protein [Patescibacteria group bacterium]